jgi:murein DD-endopeptidase MepM/ murein hydrolase activator NlpD
MRNCVLTEKSRLLSRGAAILVLSGFGAGCSADMSRFTYKDFTTGSVNQQQIMRKVPKAQPFPEQAQTYDTGSLDQAGSDAGFEPVKSKSAVSRQVLAPVTTAAAKPQLAAPRLTPARQTVTPVELAAAEEFGVSDAPAAAPKMIKKKAAPAVSALDDTTTGTVAPKVRKIELARKKVEPLSVSEETDAAPKVKKLGPKAVESASADKGGWTADGGTPVTVREGETLYNLSKRFGVPVASLLKANGLSDASEVKAGQKIIVPAYRYSHNSDVSAPDANFDTAAAKSSSGTVYDVPQDKVPLPNKVPSRQNVAVLPAVPQLKQKAAPVEVAAAEPKTTAKTDRLKPESASVLEEAATAPAVKTAPKKLGGSGDYAVAQGDSLYKIAKAHGVSVDALKSANGLQDGKLKIGQPLRIPAAGEKVVAQAKPEKIDPIETGAAPQAVKTLKPVIQEAKVKEYTPPKSDDVKAEADQDNSAAPNATGISKLRWPVRGRTVSGYGQRDGGTVSDGVNISVPEGTAIKAAENGVVIYAGNGLKEFGNTVLVRHANGLVTVYGYAKEIDVKRGQTIKRGEVLGKTGLSASAKVPMMHFQVRKNSTPVDPAAYLE